MKKILIILLIFLLGCSEKVPKWYLKSYNSQQYIYATGTGNSKKEAISNALSLAASKVAVNINSTFENLKGYYKENGKINYYEDVKNKTIMKVKNFNFYDYKIVKISKIEKYYVLIKIDKMKNANMIYEKALIDFNNFKKYLLIQDKIEILKKYPNLIKKLDENLAKLFIAKTLYPSNKINNLIDKYISLKQKIKNRLNNISFNILKDYNNIITNTLTSLNYKISNRGIKIILNKKINRYKIAGFNIFEIKLHIKMSDKSEYSFNINCAGKSITNFEVAKSFAIKNCEEKLKNKFLIILQTPL